MKRITLLVVFTVLATPASAHQDTILFIGPDDVIQRLPPEYRWTRLHVAFSEGDAGALQQLVFLSSSRETSVQPCLLRLVPKGSFDQVFLTGSWYHKESLLPHYVNVQFHDSPYRNGWPETPGTVHFLFSLRDASLLRVMQGSGVLDIRSSNGCPA
jgi:hypothetical protein